MTFKTSVTGYSGSPRLAGVVGWCDGAGKLPVPMGPSNLDKSRQGSRFGGGLFGHFLLSYIISLFFLPLSGRRPEII